MALTSSAAGGRSGKLRYLHGHRHVLGRHADGSVSFYDGTTLLGTGALAAGVATYTTLNLPVGALSITAVYSGDTNFSTLTSAGSYRDQ